MQEHTQLEQTRPALMLLESVFEQIPAKELKQCIESELGEFCSETAIEQIVQYTGQVIHYSILQPRHKLRQTYLGTIAFLIKMRYDVTDTHS